MREGNQMNKTKDLIENLSQSLLKPSPTQNWRKQFWVSWCLSFGSMVSLTLLAGYLLPAYLYLPSGAQTVSFWIESFSWLLLSLVSAGIVYQQALAQSIHPVLLKLSFTAILVLSIVVIVKTTPSALATDMDQELHWIQGPCGLFIFITGLFTVLGLSFIIKKAAPIQLTKTGIWLALSLGALGSLCMHLVCPHENSTHVLLWHVVPLMLLMGLTSKLSEFTLRW